MRSFTFNAVDDQVNALAERLSAELSALLNRQSRVVLALSGGRSPVRLFRKLSTADLEWKRVIVTLVDERLVPSSHPDSNAWLVNKYLLKGYAASATFQPLVTLPDNAEACLAEAIRHFQYPDIAILGMGDDGHTASLFPGAAELPVGLDLSTPFPVIAATSPVAPYRRFTLTRAALMKARHLYLSIQGEAKRKVLTQACTQETLLLPISYFVQQTEVPLDVYWAP